MKYKLMDDLGIIDQGHSKGNFAKFSLYLGYARTNCNNISTTMMTLRSATKFRQNVGQDRHCISTNVFYQNFIEMIAK